MNYKQFLRYCSWTLTPAAHTWAVQCHSSSSIWVVLHTCFIVPFLPQIQNCIPGHWHPCAGFWRVLLSYGDSKCIQKRKWPKLSSDLCNAIGCTEGTWGSVISGNKGSRARGTYHSNKPTVNSFWKCMGADVDLQGGQNRIRHFLATKRYTQEAQCKLKPEVKLNHHSQSAITGVVSQFSTPWGFKHCCYRHIWGANTHQLPHPHCLPLHSSLYLQPLCLKNSSQINPSNFLVLLVGLQVSPGCEVKKKGKSEDRQSNRGDTNPPKQWKGSFWILRTCSGWCCYPYFTEPRPARRWHSLWGFTSLYKKKEAPIQKKHTCKTCLSHIESVKTVADILFLSLWWNKYYLLVYTTCTVCFIWVEIKVHFKSTVFQLLKLFCLSNC